MAEFKCINCGETKEANKKVGFCPNCGYKMYKTPYDKSEILIKEIRSYLSKLKLSSVDNYTPEIFRFETKGKNKKKITKQQDDMKHFPHYYAVCKYIFDVDKTEQLIENLNRSIEQMEAHIKEYYTRDYIVTCEVIEDIAEFYDEDLQEAFDIIGFQGKPEKLVMPEMKLKYEEIPNADYMPLADKIIGLLKELSAKISRFIKVNNAYGCDISYEKVGKNFKFKKGLSETDILSGVIDELKAIIKKNYVVDIFSDGAEELEEMFTVCCKAFFVLYTQKVLKRKFTYTFNDAIKADDKTFMDTISKELDKRYSALDERINAESFLADKSEAQLFDIYNDLVDVDYEGFMGMGDTKRVNIGQSERALQALVGLAPIKESVKKIKAFALANKGNSVNLHMCFYGNPGTGKTEVARIIAGILYENKILPTKNVIEVDRSGLVSQYFGATAQKTQNVIDSAMGGVLFIDEAYALGNNSDLGIDDYGKEAIDTLVKAMEDYRGKFCVIFAGYKNETKKMIGTNPGLRSRIAFELDFPNYSREELEKITNIMLKSRHYTISEQAMSKVLDITDVKRKDSNFANAREIRNIVEQVIMCQNIRCLGTDEKQIEIVDVNKYITDAKIDLPLSADNQNQILTADEQLDALIGLQAVKRMVKKIRAYAKKNQSQADFNLHMCFYGNPGTGKTEVARLLSQLLYDAGVLEEAKLVETDAHGLMGAYVGETAPKTQEKIDEAMGGVLFIDEAYALTSGSAADGRATSYGDEALAVLLKEMEDKRGRFCVIFAGYKEEMKAMLSSNPGLESRVQFKLDFPDYSEEELQQIAKVFLHKKQYEITDDALQKIGQLAEYFRNKDNFANARTIRNILDQVIMNQNLRTEEDEGNSIIILEDVEDYIADEDIDLSDSKPKATIGFV